MEKSPDAFRTISEVSAWLDTPAHVLRFWESRFTQVKPVKRAGGRRYYRPADMQLLGGIKKLLHDDGLTIRGVQKILREEGVKFVADLSPPMDEGGPVIEGQADRPSAPPAPKVPEAPMHENAEPETPDARIVVLGRESAVKPRREPAEAMLPGLEPDPAPDPVQPELAFVPPPAPPAPPERVPAQVSAPEPAPAAEPEPEPAAPRPLGTGLPRTDPADDDPAFAPVTTPLRTALRDPALRRALMADPAPAQEALVCLYALSEKMKAGTPRPRA